MIKLAINIILISILLTISSPLFSQTKYSSTHKKQNLYVCMDDLSPNMKNYLKQKNIPIAIIIYSNFIDPQKQNIVDTAALGNRIRSIVPTNVTSIGILDWEPSVFFDNTNAKDPKYIAIIKEFTKAILYAKKLRPNIKWGFYGLPFREYWHFTNSWQSRSMNLIPLLKNCDILAPSLYDFFPDAQQRRNTEQYITNNVGMALRIGSMINKPVYPFVWHRWHESNKDYGLQPIPEEEFTRHIKQILNTTVAGNQVAGILWWGAEKFFYNHKSPVLIREAKNYKNFNNFQDSILQVYSNTFLKIFNNR